MTDVSTETQAEVADSPALKIPVVKGKDTIDIFTDKLPDHVYREAMFQGLKVLINRSMSKITKTTYPKEDELKAAALAKAAEVLEALYAGKIRVTGAKADKVSGAVMTEARRLARNMVKDEMKRQGIKVSYVDSKDITAAANTLIAENPSIIEEAKKSIEARDAKASQVAKALAGVAKSIPINAAKQKKIEDKKAEAKAQAKQQLSAMQAGKVATRQKPAARQ